MKSVILVAHPDDESVGIFTLLRRGATDRVVLYNTFERVSQERIKELVKLCADFSIDVDVFTNEDSPEKVLRIMKGNIVYAPTPNCRHPAHRFLGAFALAHINEVAKLYFYDPEMIEPWALPLPEEVSREKREHLLKYYPSQRDLWLSDGKYWLFEGVVEVVKTW